MAVPTTAHHYTYADLEQFPEENVRREIVGGELIVSPSPRPRHQEVADEPSKPAPISSLKCPRRPHAAGS